MHKVIALLLAGYATICPIEASPVKTSHSPKPISNIDLGPRPYYLVNNMTDGRLKSKLESCMDNQRLKKSTFSLGHRGGACLQFPEHSKESNLAGARMGAGMLECDVTFTKDRQLVCRHSQCDLHTTTNIVAIPELNAKCSQPFTPAKDGSPASAKCCTSDITLAEFKSLCAKMDASNTTATTPQDFLGGTPSWRTDLYATCGKLLDHKEHIALVESLKLEHTPELKAPEISMPYDGDYTHEKYAQQIIDNYKEAGVPASRVHTQSFEVKSVRYWIKNEPDFGRNAILLDESGDKAELFPQAVKNLEGYAKEGIKTLAPPMNYLVEVRNGTMWPSAYAIEARKLRLKLVTWSLERSPPMALVHKNGDYYYSSVQDVVKVDGDIYTYVHVLANDVGVAAIFSDWSGTVTFYANCFNLGLEESNFCKKHECE